ncbi:hypothetical protein WG936_08045 [Corynebacterium sp. H127]|uniref:hypothetical protein n=1 Tax=Corynebacterium sp. H127 TaxID=3133418 RepID=UPI0030A3FF81
MKHTEWFRILTSGASGLEASTKAGITTSTLNRQLSKGELSAEFVIALARGYGQNPAEALAATGYLTMEEVAGVSEEALAELLTDRQVIRIAALRINSDPDAWFGTFGELEPEDESITDIHARRASKHGLERVVIGKGDAVFALFGGEWVVVRDIEAKDDETLWINRGSGPIPFSLIEGQYSPLRDVDTKAVEELVHSKSGMPVKTFAIVELADDLLVSGINSEELNVAAQKSTDPIDESY